MPPIGVRAGRAPVDPGQNLIKICPFWTIRTGGGWSGGGFRLVLESVLPAAVRFLGNEPEGNGPLGHISALQRPQDGPIAAVLGDGEQPNLLGRPERNAALLFPECDRLLRVANRPAKGLLRESEVQSQIAEFRPGQPTPLPGEGASDRLRQASTFSMATALP